MGATQLRMQLREATAPVHARLDRLVGHMPLSSQADYTAFLLAQSQARQLLDKAFAKQPPAFLPAPPVQAGLIAFDLRELGVEAPILVDQLSLDCAHASLGAAWALAGSSLGNRAMLVRREKAGLGGPVRFLSDPAMPLYFQRLLEVLGRPFAECEIAAAASGANVAFAAFERAFAAHMLEVAA